MVVKIFFPKRTKGDASVTLSFEDAKTEIENATKNGYIASYKDKQVLAKNLQDGQEVTFTPTGMGG